MSEEIVSQEEALAAFHARQKEGLKPHQVFKFVYTPQDDEDWDQTWKRALKRKSAFAKVMQKPREEEEDAASSIPAQEEDIEYSPQLDVSTLPDDLAQIVQTLQDDLAKGELESAVAGMDAIKQILNDCDRFAQNMPIDFAFERKLFLDANCIVKDEPQYNQLQMVCPPNTPVSQLSYREVYKLKQASKKCRQQKYASVAVGDRELKASSFAILVDLAMQRKPVAMYIAPGNYEKAAQVIQSNIGLGAFLQIVPLHGQKQSVLDDKNQAFKSIMTIQKLIQARNYNFPSCGPLHVLATIPQMTSVEKSLLVSLLDEEKSLQTQAVTQKSIQGCTPLVEAIIHMNMQFIKTLLESNVAFKVPLNELMPIESEQLMRALTKHFAPSKQSNLDKRKYPQDAQDQYLIDLLVALQEHLQKRAEHDNQNLNDLAKPYNDAVLKYVRGLKLQDNATETRKWIQATHRTTLGEVQRVRRQDVPKEFWRVYQRYYYEEDDEKRKKSFMPNLFVLKHIISSASEAQIERRCAIGAMFSHPELYSGQLIMQMGLKLSHSDLASMLEKVPGLKNLFYQATCPLQTKFFIGQKGSAQDSSNYPFANRLMLIQDFDIKLKDLSMQKFPSSITNYCYSLKLALLGRPNDSQLHDQILSNMNFDSLQQPELQFEMLCLLAKVKGFKHPKTLELFKKHVWLMGQEQPPIHSVVLKKDGMIDFNKLKVVYPDVKYAYPKLVLSLCKTMLQNQETDLFEEFMLSMRSFFMPKQVIGGLMRLALSNYAIDCFGVIMALCYTEKIKFTCPMAYQEKDKDSSQITREQVRMSHALQTLLTYSFRYRYAYRTRREKQFNTFTSDLQEFLELAPPSAANRCIDLILKYRLITWHATMRGKDIHDTDRMSDMNIINNRVLVWQQSITNAILSKADVQTTVEYVRALLEDAKNFSDKFKRSGPRLKALFIILNFFRIGLLRIDQMSMEPTVHHLYRKNQIENTLGGYLSESIRIPSHRAYLEQCFADESLCQLTADWIGVGVDKLRSEYEKSLSQYTKLAHLDRIKYDKSDIGFGSQQVELSKLSEETGLDFNPNPSMIKLRATSQQKTRHNSSIEQLITLQKFEAVKDMLLCYTEDFNLSQHVLIYVTHIHTYPETQFEDAKRFERMLNDEDKSIKGLIEMQKNLFSYLNPLKRRCETPQQAWGLLLMEPFLVKSFKKILDQHGMDPTEELKLILDYFTRTIFKEREVSDLLPITYKKHFSKLFNSFRKSMCGVVTEDLDRLVHLLELCNRIEKGDQKNQRIRGHCGSDDEKEPDSWSEGNYDGRSEGGGGGGGGDSYDEEDGYYPGHEGAESEESGYSDMDAHHQYIGDHLTNLLRQKAGKFESIKFRMQDYDERDYFIQPAYTYFVKPIEELLLRDASLNSDVFDTEFRKRLVNFMLFTAPEETICRLFADGQLSQPKIFGCARKRGSERFFRRSEQSWTYADSVLRNLLVMPSDKMSTKAKAALTIGFINGLKKQFSEENLKEGQDKDWSDQKHGNTVKMILHQIVISGVFSSPECQSSMNEERFKFQFVDQHQRVLQASDAILIDLNLVYERGELITFERMKELCSLFSEPFDFKKMEAELRQATSEEIKAEAKSIGQSYRPWCRKPKRQPTWIFDSDDQDSDSSSSSSENSAQKSTKKDDSKKDKQETQKESDGKEKDGNEKQQEKVKESVDSATPSGQTPEPEKVKKVASTSSSCCTIF